jgi:hypothetical protein
MTIRVEKPALEARRGRQAKLALAASLARQEKVAPAESVAREPAESPVLVGREAMPAPAETPAARVVRQVEAAQQETRALAEAAVGRNLASRLSAAMVAGTR